MPVRPAQDNDGALDKLEFKAALAAMSIPVRDDAALVELIAKVSGGGATISQEQWIAYMCVEQTRAGGDGKRECMRGWLGMARGGTSRGGGDRADSASLCLSAFFLFLFFSLSLALC